jgi:signal transduction histidine kinase/CheY-like chemotaxis protein
MVRAIAVKNDLGEVVRVIGSHTDITELKRNDSELQQGRRLRAIGELVGGIAHEFNNLLTPMLLQTTMMTGDGTPQSALLKEQLMPVVGAIKEARELTQRILTFGRRSTDDLEQLDLTAAVHEHLELLRHTIDRRLVIDVIPPAQPMWVMQNRTDMAQIIINLVLNARDTLLEKTAATNDASWVPTITIRLATVSELASRSQTLSGLLADEGPHAVSWHRVTVRDNGMGMTDDVRERIFEPFYTTKEAGQGTGLGLATVWHLVKSMGGRVDVETKVGLGSAFHVSWPAISAPLETTEPAPLKSEPSTTVRRQSARILLVEDEVEVTGSLSRILEKWGHQVTAVRDGTSALRRLAGGENEFDICITDLNMPGASGFDVVRAIREQQMPLKVVVMGGYVTAGVRQELSAWQIESILPKPFSLEDIETSMKACGW